MRSAAISNASCGSAACPVACSSTPVSSRTMQSAEKPARDFTMLTCPEKPPSKYFSTASPILPSMRVRNASPTSMCLPEIRRFILMKDLFGRLRWMRVYTCSQRLQGWDAVKYQTAQTGFFLIPSGSRDAVLPADHEGGLLVRSVRDVNPGPAGPRGEQLCGLSFRGGAVWRRV